MQRCIEEGHERELVVSHSTQSGTALTGTAWILLIACLLLFIVIQSFLPLRTTVLIGGDEGFELSKALLCLKGHKPYSEVWNDQPPLHTFIITEVLRYISPSVLGPRLVTTGFALVLLSSLFLIAHRFSGLLAATVTTALLIFSPGFLSLGSSCMLEIPALAVAVAAIAVASVVKNHNWSAIELASGALFGIALSIKLIPIVLVPVALFVCWLREPPSPTRFRKTIYGVLVLFVAMLLSFVLTDLVVDQGAFLVHFQQTWMSHFGGTRSFEYGSPADHPFDWKILVRNWDTTIPAACGVVLILRTARKKAVSLIPVLWLVLMLIIFGFHRPWWSYYYVHLAVPLSWMAAIGIQHLFELTTSRKKTLLSCVLAVYCLVAAAWMCGRVYVQVLTVRRSPQLYTALPLKEIEPYKPLVQWMYADEPVYCFHAGIPAPPDLAVLMLKRLWSGDMTNAKITSELESIKPGIMLLANNSQERPFQHLLNSEYRMIYIDANFRLYVHESIVNKVQR